MREITNLELDEISGGFFFFGSFMSSWSQNCGETDPAGEGKWSVSAKWSASGKNSDGESWSLGDSWSKEGTWKLENNLITIL